MKDEIIKKLKDYNQTHITGHIDTLTEKEKVTFLNHLAGLDIDLVFKLYKDFQNQNRDKKDTYITPASVITTPKTDDEIAFRNKAKKVGENIIRENKVAVLIVAGGQGTRLGFYGPKGTFKISPVMGKSFFQLFSEQIIALSR
ncbi:MAG TPA: UTP--glucose-1-phosphate uridylyltransferase, partial [Syntrophorhabdaceae bacterium]|nr:UTP--glucose-1-phosphate uridylyltransferase [Syntrophorhabdaceae bacterium]